MIGSVLSGDVIARYLRLRGYETLYVSGSDEHGTPIEVEAIKRGISPKELTDKVHTKIKNLFKRWGISFDNYTRTESEVHKEFVREFYIKVYKNGYIFEKEVELLYCTKDNLFLPDRFVEGVCPYCGYNKARGDQCENCGRLLEPVQLISPKCAICGSKPIIKKSKHWYIDLSALEDKIREYIENNKNFDDVTRRYSLSYLEKGLQPRSITRDNKWGIPAPFPGSEGKTIYVWMEAVLGYISATIECMKVRGEPDGWKRFWFDPDCRTLYFIGKDNIPFHTIILPALLMASGEHYNLPWNVASTEFLTFEKRKFSKSQKIGIWIDEALKLAPPDYWRYALLAVRPEGKDTDFSLELFVNLVNSHLNDTLGNFIHRTLSLLWNYFEGIVPEPSEFKESDIELMNKIKDTYNNIMKELEAIKIKRAIEEFMELARGGNRYLNEREPWKLYKKHPEEAKTVIYVALQVVKALAIFMMPFMPFTAEKLLTMLKIKKEGIKWSDALIHIEPGHKIGKPEPLFHKLDLLQLRKKLERIRARHEVD